MGKQRMKMFKLTQLNDGYEEIFFFDKKFHKKYVVTDEWWDLKYLPSEHDPYDFQIFINQLQAYSEERNDPVVIEFGFGIKSMNLKEPTFYHTWEDVSTPQHLSDIINTLVKANEHFKNKNQIPFVYKAWIICKPLKRKKLRRRTRIPKGMRKEVFKRDNYTCVQCGASKEDGATLHIDHIIPVSRGGTDELDNLQTLCSDCNLNKSDLIQ